MDAITAIGGFFELERAVTTPIRWARAVNSGRSGLELILKEYHPCRLLIPAFICPCVPEFLKSINQKFDFYHINEHLEIVQNIDIKKNEMLLYVNYFGIKDDYCKTLQQRYRESLILDLTQALFYQTRVDIPSFSSLRKFFGVPDGGFVTGINQETVDKLPIANGTSYAEHLLLRADLNLEKGYPLFKENNEHFTHEHPYQMSNLSHYILGGIDFNIVRKKRMENFSFLHSCLSFINELNIENRNLTPLSYPLLIDGGKEIKEKLISRKIFVPTYWPNMRDLSNIENRLAENIVHLPIDHRYGVSEMFFIIDILNEQIKVFQHTNPQESFLVYLRPLRREDAQVSWRWRNDADVWKYTFSHPDRLITPEIEDGWITNVLADTSRRAFAICLKNNHKYIGNTYLNIISESSAEFSIFIGEKAYWGKGIGRKATQLTLEYATKVLKIRKIILRVKEANVRARRAYEKAGFQLKSQKGEDILMEYLYK